MAKQTLRHILTLVAVLTVAVSAYAQKWDMDVAAGSTLRMDSTLFQDNPSQLYRYYFIEAVAQQNRGNHGKAFALLRRCIDLNPNAAEAYYEIADYYVDQKDNAEARHCLERAAELQPRNATYLERLGQFYINQSEYERATEVYEQVYAANKSRADVVEMLYRLYYVQEDTDKMLEMLNRLETIEGSSEQLSLTKMQVYEQQGKRGKQLDELRSLVAKHPNDPNYRIMMANWLIQNDKAKEALAELKAVLKDEPDNVSAQMSMLDYYRTTGDKGKAASLLEQLLHSAKTPQATKLTLLYRMVYNNMRDEADDSVRTLRLIDGVLAEKQENADILMLKAGYMSLHKMPKADINAVLQQALDVEPDNTSARWQLINNIWADEDWDRIIALSRPAQEYNPTEMLFYYSEGMAEFQKDDRETALETFRKGVAQINKDSNPALASDFYAIMGDLLHEKGLDDEAFAAYDSCLVWKDDNISALNNYAYYLCLKDSDLNRAEQMSRKTLEAEPDNATYLDTYAWILFQQGRYADALTYIEHAVASDSTLSNVVKEHTGDIYAMNGNIEKALEYWQKALAFDKENATLQEKIKQKRYIKQ